MKNWSELGSGVQSLCRTAQLNSVWGGLNFIEHVGRKSVRFWLISFLLYRGMARCNHHGRVPQDRASLSGNVCLSVACMHSSASASLCLAGTHPLCWLISRKCDVGSPSSTITKALEHVHSHVSCFTAAKLCLLPLIPSLEFIMLKKRSTALLSGGHFPYWDCVLAKILCRIHWYNPFPFPWVKLRNSQSKHALKRWTCSAHGVVPSDRFPWKIEKQREINHFFYWELSCMQES